MCSASRRAWSSAPQAIEAMPACFCSGWHVDRHAVVLQHGDQRLGQLRVEVVGVDVDEVEHLLAAAAGRAGEPAAGRPAQKAPRRHPRQLPPLGDPQRLLQQPAHLPVAPAPNWPPGRPGRPARRAGRAGSWPSRPAAGRWPPRRPPCSRASAAECPRRPGTPAGRQWQWTHRSATALNSSLVKQAEIERAGQDAADQVGLRPRRGLFGRREAEDGAHAQLGRLRAALAAAVARRHGVADPRRLPVQLQLDQVPQLGGDARRPAPRGRVRPAAAAGGGGAATAPAAGDASADRDRRRRSCPD